MFPARVSCLWNATDLLNELIIKQGLGLKEHDIRGKKVCVVGLGTMIACLADDISLDTVERVSQPCTRNSNPR